MHLAIYAATKAGAVVHTHSPEVIALSAGRDELPAIHYAITGLGGPVPGRALRALRVGGAGGLGGHGTGGRSAVILRNHGAVATAATWPRPTTGRCCSSGWPAPTGSR